MSEIDFSWSMPAHQMADHIAKASQAYGVHDPRGHEMRTAILRARVAFDAAQAQEEIGGKTVSAARALVKATDRLALATAGLVVATVVLIVVTIA